MTYQELKQLFRDHEKKHPKTHPTAYITFSSFGPDNHDTYSWKDRTYSISSENKAFEPNKGGYSIFEACLNGSDPCLRLDRFMKEEHGGKDGWVVETCCVVGYVLLHTSDSGISVPKMFYSPSDAREQMVTELAKLGELDVESLKAECVNRTYVRVDSHYGVFRDTAWLSDMNTDDWKWNIQPVRIYSLTSITFGHE